MATKLTGAVGEFLVAAELCRRNLLATPFAGNVPHYDIIASGQFGGHVAVQVKAINGLTWQFDIRKFADFRLSGEDGKHQIYETLYPANPAFTLGDVLALFDRRPELTEVNRGIQQKRVR